MSESALQMQICQSLQAQGIYFFSVPNEALGKIHYRGDRNRMMRLISMGLRPGVSDLVCLLPGSKAVFLEVKTDKGRQSDNQKRFQERVESLGFKYFVVRSIKDVDIAISSC